MRLLWRVLIGIGGLLLLLLVAAAIAVHTLDLRSFIGPIQSRVRDATGRELKVNGDIDLKISLVPKVVIEDVALSNAPWGKTPQMITAKHVEVEVELLPLLHRDFQVRSFTLIDPVIALETDGKGTGNWEFAKSAPGTSAAATPAAAANAGDLFVSDVSIVNGTLTYRDGETGKLTTVSIAELALNARDPQSALSVRFRGSVDDIAIALEGDLGPLTSLAQRRWPYPVTLKGQVEGQQVSVDTKLKADDAGVSLDPLELGVGKSRLTGQMVVGTGKPRPKLSFKLAAASLSLADLAIPAAKPAGKAGARPPAAVKSRYVFSDRPIDLSVLRSIDANGDLTAEVLVLPDGRRLDKVHLQFALQNGVLDAPVVQAGIFGGTLAAHVKIDASHEKDAALNLHADAKGLDLAAILAEAGVKREVRGGKTTLNADIAARGVSPHQWAGSASGNVLLMVGAATLAHASDNSDAAFNKLADAVNPFRKVDTSTELLCAVIRLPLAGGISRVDRSIGVETNKVGANASGTLDFRDETLDLSVKPQIRKGITLNIDSIASLVRFHGPFTAPTVGVDAVASVATVATIGAALSTGGASLLGQTLLAGATTDPGAPCQIALGRGGKTQTDANASATPHSPAQELSNAVGRLFRR